MATMRIPTDSAVYMDKNETLHLTYLLDGTVDHNDKTSPYHFNPRLDSGHVQHGNKSKTATNAGDITIKFDPDRKTDESLFSMHTIHITNTLTLNLTNRGGSDVELPFTDKLILNFEVAGYFCTKDAKDFPPPLPNGYHDRGTSGPYKPLEKHRTIKYSFDPKQPCDDHVGPKYRIQIVN
jgi:hypothetical protein